VVVSEPSVTWQAEYATEGEACFRVGARGDEVVAEWIGIATLTARRDGSHPQLSFEADADPLFVEKITRGTAWLLVRDLEGKLALHGSAIEIGGKAFVFLGRSGQGKSTLAAALCRRGGGLLADDAVGIDPSPNGGWTVVARERDHWLDADSLRALGEESAHDDKTPIRAERPATVGAPLAAFVDLRFGGVEPTLTRLGGIEVVGSLVPQVARFILDDEGRQRRELDLLHRLANEVPCFRLERRASLAQLGSAVDVVLERLCARTDATVE
jgi:hypothetical protein